VKLVFASNYFNHHQSSLSNYLHELTGHNYWFIATEAMEEERKTMGWSNIDIPPFVLDYSANPTRCAEIIDNADAVIWGSAPLEVVQPRLSQGKLTLFYSERIHTAGYNRLKLIKHAPQMYMKYGRYKNLYLLCASAFAAFDYAQSRTFVNKTYKWGYFPPFEKRDDIMELIRKKPTDEVEILYVSRLIPLKHPELPLQVAARLMKDRIPFHLTMIGHGEMSQIVNEMIDELGVRKSITRIDSLSPDEVRKHMDKANIFLFTSDSHEGWGAVMNESMSSACAVVASSEIGSVPFLIEDNKNGCIYQDGDLDDLYRKVKALCLDQALREKLGTEAYHTIENTWNAETAAKRLLELITDLKDDGKSNRFLTGPCSRAEILKDGWYK
jgi:glycosyltransferase involved in cell wall biosynthesis